MSQTKRLIVCGFCEGTGWHFVESFGEEKYGRECKKCRGSGRVWEKTSVRYEAYVPESGITKVDKIENR